VSQPFLNEFVEVQSNIDKCILYTNHFQKLGRSGRQDCLHSQIQFKDACGRNGALGSVVEAFSYQPDQSQTGAVQQWLRY
jgi:hypothetical protein